MTSDEDPTGLPFGMSQKALLRWTWILAALFFLMAVVSIAGELFGWWNDLGEVGATVGSIASLILTMGSFYYSAGQEQLGEVHDAVLDGNRKLNKLDQLDELDVIQAELDRQTGALDQQVEILGAIRDRL